MAERTASVHMRNRIEQLLNKAASLMIFFWNGVNNALMDRIRTQVEARHQLQLHLSKVIKYLSNVKRYQTLNNALSPQLNNLVFHRFSYKY